MTSVDADILNLVVDFYLNSGDFNGLPLARLNGEVGPTVAAVVASGDVLYSLRKLLRHSDDRNAGLCARVHFLEATR